MKGLLTKDFALFFQRKKTFLFLAAWAVVMCVATKDGGFVIGWVSIISAFFAISSLAYDEYDNGYPFLMSLPISPRIYVLEKYLFGFLCGFGSWLFAAVICFSACIAKGNTEALGTELRQFPVFIPVFILLIDISLPVHIRFGSERGRTLLLILWGVIFAGSFAAIKVFMPSLPFDMNTLTGSALTGAAFLFSIVFTAASILLSIHFMQKKEF